MAGAAPMTTTRPTVSVVLPVFDAAPTLPAALESLRAQSERDWEVVAVDDGSSDGSLETLHAYARRDARIRVLATPHHGLVPALTAGLEVARGPFIARMDADDVSLPERLACQRRHLERHPGVGLVAARVAFEGDPERQAGYARYVAWTNALLTHEEIALGRFVESPLIHPSVMFRRELVGRLGGYAAGAFPEDYELWLRWLDAGVRMEKLPETLLRWRDRPGRLSRRDPRYAAEAFYRLKARYLARWLAAHNPHHPSVVVWGGGRLTRRRAGHLSAQGIAVSAWVDIDPRKIGATPGGAPVLAPHALPPPGRAFVVSYVGSRGARDEIEGVLRARGYRPGDHYILAA
jgi:cellulose synthase/poly-beta-1,6-N-acetylglucosamine synthase-like glycosyltransferase